MKEKKLEASTSCSISEGGTLCMIEVEKPDCCKYVSEYSYDAIEKSWDWQLLAIIYQEDPVRATNGLKLKLVEVSNFN